MERKPIFYDHERRRWRRTRLVLEISGVLFTLVLVTFFLTVIHRVDLPSLLLPSARTGLRPAPAESALKGGPAVHRTGRRNRIAALGQVAAPAALPAPAVSTVAYSAPVNYDPLRIAFYVSWDPSSLASLQQHFHDVDLLVPEQLHAVTADGHLAIENDAKLEAWMQTLKVRLPTMALLNNSDGTNWFVPQMAAMLHNPNARQNLIRQLLSFAVDSGQSGLVLDFEQVPHSSQPDFLKFISELGFGLHGADLKLMVALPAADWDYDYTGISRASDAIILMNYDQHWLTSPPGPIAAQDWYVRNISEILKLVPREKLIMGVANYAYDWPHKKRPAASGENALVESFQQAIVTASESDAAMQYDSNSLNPNYSYYDEHGVLHEVWMLDGVTCYNQERAAENFGVRGTALWRLGTEDPSLWSIWDATHPTDASRARLADMPPGYDLVLEGNGDIWSITSTPQKGQRAFRFDSASGNIVEEKYTALPFSYRIEQLGAARGKIALSFDDGPDPRWTPQILNILKEKQAPATFFVIGSNANQYLGLLKREYDEGHEIGNHTYTHPEMELISHGQLTLELNLTARLFASTLGVKTLLFRPPYGIDHQPETADEVASLPIPQSMGYLLVGARIDPHDWGEPGGKPPADTQTIINRVVDQAEDNEGSIILLHDGGGDRSHTVAALPGIIDGLRDAGFELVAASDLIDQSRAQVMLPLDFRERMLARTDALIFTLYQWVRLGVAWIFLLGIALVSGRAVIIGILALIERLTARMPGETGFHPPVSVLIPAYNEEAVIVGTVQAALAGDYSQLEVVVVNDGSHDRTGELLDTHFGGDPRVQVIHQVNRGKSAALSAALRHAHYEILVTIDADTEIAPDAISRMVRHLADPRVGAVAGNVKVGNRNSWLTRWQALEYITSQNLEKRAFDLLNCIPVVPGAMSAWRAEAIRESGGFTADTVAEDTDLTIAIRRRGWRITYAEEAIGWTEAPETTAMLIRQRFRWTFGTLQSFWKHGDTLARPRYGTLGWIALPNMFLFQLLLPLFSPIIDLLFMGSLVLWGLGHFHLSFLPQFWTAADVELSVLFFAAFMLIDFFTCVIAFALEPQEDWSLLWPLLIQRFWYRQMMYVVLFRAVKRAVQGSAVGWRGVEPESAPPLVPAPAPQSTGD